MKSEIKFDIILLVICLSLLYIGGKTTNDLKWPYGLDNFREIAQTQTILDGDYGKDPYYLNEHVWYNPGCHFVIGGISLLLNVPVPEGVGKFGAYLNILAPIAFYIMIRIMFGCTIALTGTTAYLFIINSSYPVWASSLYSPWFFPATFSQTFFYITITLFYKAIKTNRGKKYYIATGISLGVTFLFHTAPAFLAGGVISLFFLGKIVEHFKKHGSSIKSLVPLLKNLLYVIFPALIISMIFLYFIIWHYHLRIVNVSPTSWEWHQVALKKIPTLLRNEFFQVFSVISIYGLLHLLKKNGDVEAKKINLFWLVISLGYLIYYFFRISLMDLGANLPLIVPSYHFFFYLKSLSYVFFGYGTIVIVRMFLKVLEDNIGFFKRWKHKLLNNFPYMRVAVCLLFSILLSLYVLNVYSQNKRLLKFRSACLHHMMEADFIKSYYWIRQHTDGNDVFLCSNEFSMKVVAPAARKVIATSKYFSNPYVDFNERNFDRNRMFENLKSGNVRCFVRLCKKYRAKYIITTISKLKKNHKSYQIFLKKVFKSGDVVILELQLDKTHVSIGKIFQHNLMEENG